MRTASLIAHLNDLKRKFYFLEKRTERLFYSNNNKNQKSLGMFRNHEYCKIPECNKEGLTQNERIIVPVPIQEIFNKLECGCLPFEYRSHLPNCKYWNTDEDQPYYSGCLS